MIFDLSLTDKYINSLSYEDSRQLQEEADDFCWKVEESIAELVGAVYDDGAGLKPSQYSWDPALYQDDIEEMPWLHDRLLEAQELTADVGRAMAIAYTAFLNEIRIEGELNG